MKAYIELNMKYEVTYKEIVALQTEKENYKKQEIIRKEEYDSIKEKYICLIENRE